MYFTVHVHVHVCNNYDYTHTCLEVAKSNYEHAQALMLLLGQNNKGPTYGTAIPFLLNSKGSWIVTSILVHALSGHMLRPGREHVHVLKSMVYLLSEFTVG